jgi:hypothetical protein
VIQITFVGGDRTPRGDPKPDSSPRWHRVAASWIWLAMKGPSHAVSGPPARGRRTEIPSDGDSPKDHRRRAPPSALPRPVALPRRCQLRSLRPHLGRLRPTVVQAVIIPEAVLGGLAARRPDGATGGLGGGGRRSDAGCTRWPAQLRRSCLCGSGGGGAAARGPRSRHGLLGAQEPCNALLRQACGVRSSDRLGVVCSQPWRHCRRRMPTAPDEPRPTAAAPVVESASWMKCSSDGRGDVTGRTAATPR